MRRLMLVGLVLVLACAAGCVSPKNGRKIGEAVIGTMLLLGK